MLFERFKDSGLAHYSYIVGEGNQAAIIDPRRDVDVYVDHASRAGYRITVVLETHRNEDYLIGSPELARRTGAEVHHADSQLEYGYGNPVAEGDFWNIGGLKLRALDTPGHTPGSMSYVLHGGSGEPLMVFTGDALFAGDVGRVDLVGDDRREAMAGLLYESLHEKILPLGDGVMVCPAHGAGSVCGGAIADREWTTIGIEKKLNPGLRANGRDRFVEVQANSLEKPPYFRKMEELNRRGPPPLSELKEPAALSPDEFRDRADSAVVLDTRSIESFGGSHVPGALSIWQEGVPAYAGWFLPHEGPVLMVNGTNDYTGVRAALLRMGYDDLPGYLAGAMTGWNSSGLQSGSVGLFSAPKACSEIDENEEQFILDVRSAGELESDGRITGAHHIHLSQLPERLDEVPGDRQVVIFCGSGKRSMTAASILARKGWKRLSVVLGGIQGWHSVRCPVRRT
jgi:hydroxyacylglutathione hydrolase